MKRHFIKLSTFSLINMKSSSFYYRDSWQWFIVYNKFFNCFSANFNFIRISYEWFAPGFAHIYFCSRRNPFTNWASLYTFSFVLLLFWYTNTSACTTSHQNFIILIIKVNRHYIPFVPTSHLSFSLCTIWAYNCSEMLLMLFCVQDSKFIDW